jgi:hypothetical protein
MTSGSPPTSPAQVATAGPGGRVVLGWWRDLSALGPRRLWFAHLVLLRVEALVGVAPPTALGGLARFLLPLLTGRTPPFTPSALAAELDAPADLVQELFGDLAAQGLLRPCAGRPDAWEPAPDEGGAAASGVGLSTQRRTFLFAEAAPPVYLPLDAQAATPLQPPPDVCRFDLAVLRKCIAQDPAWKARRHFPDDVVELAPQAEGDWRSVPLARVDQACLALVETGGGEVRGFPVRPDGWVLGKEAVLSLPGADALDPLLPEVGLDGWKAAWQVWCQQRSLPAGEAEASKLELADHRLLVQAPPRLMDRLRATRSDALKGEAWLLAGGRVRATVCIELAEA